MTPESRAYIFHGTDNYSIWQAIAELKGRLSQEGNLQVERLKGEEITPARLIEACNIGDFFSNQRLIIVEGLLTHLGKREEKATERKKKEAEQERWPKVVNYIKEGMPPFVSLVFLEESLRKERNPFYLQLSSVARVREFSILKGDELRKRIVDKVKEGGCKISPASVNSLMNLAGGNLWILSQEIEKLILYTGGRDIQEEDIKQVTGYSREASIFFLVDSIIERNKANSQNLLHQLLERGEEPVYIIAMVARQLSFLVRAKDLMDRKLRIPEIGKKLGLKDFPLDKAIAQARGCPRERLEKFYEILLNYDLSMKKGLLPKKLALEMMVSELWFA